jgi:hypothetical protein
MPKSYSSMKCASEIDAMIDGIIVVEACMLIPCVHSESIGWAWEFLRAGSIVCKRKG